MQHVGSKIKKIVQDSKYSVKEVSEKMGISSPNMYRLFERDSVETKYLVQLSEIYGISISYFFGEQPLSELANEIETIKAQLELRDETINQLQNQIIILEKLIKTNETIIQKQETINMLMSLYGTEAKDKIDPSEPGFEKLYKLASELKDNPDALMFLLKLKADPELKNLFFDYIEKYKK